MNSEVGEKDTTRYSSKSPKKKIKIKRKISKKSANNSPDGKPFSHLYLHTANGSFNSKRITEQIIINEGETDDLINVTKDDNINHRDTPQPIVFYPSQDAGFQYLTNPEQMRTIDHSSKGTKTSA